MASQSLPTKINAHYNNFQNVDTASKTLNYMYNYLGANNVRVSYEDEKVANLINPTDENKLFVLNALNKTYSFFN